MNKLTLTLALSLGAALGAPAAASADTFCINLPACVGTDVASPQEALDIAALNNQADTVRIGPKATPYGGGLSYVDPERITIIGAGSDATKIAATLSDPAIVGGNSTSRVEGLHITYGDDVQLGLRLGSVADDVRVTGTGVNTDTAALRLLDGGSFRNGFVSSPGRGVESLADTGANIVDSVVSGLIGIQTAGTGKHLNASRVYVFATRTGASASGGELTIDNSVIQVTSHALASGVYVLTGSSLIANHLTVVGGGTGDGIVVATSNSGSPANATVSNSIVTGFPTALERWGDIPAANLTMRYSTWGGGAVTDTGPGQLDTSAGNLVAAPEFVNPGGLVPNLRLMGGSALIDAGDPGDLLIEDKDGLAREVDGDGQGGARSDIGAYEYQRRAPESDFTITPAAPVAGQQVNLSASPTKDLDHGDRAASTYAWTVDGAAAGQGMQLAHTFAGGGSHTVELTVTDPGGASDTVSKTVLVAAPAAAPQDPQQPQQPPSGAGTDSVAPLVGGLRAGPRRVRFRLSEAARVTVRVKRRGTRRARVIRISGSAGANSARLGRRALRDGRYRLTVVATDAAGNSSARRTLRLRVR